MGVSYSTRLSDAQQCNANSSEDACTTEEISYEGQKTKETIGRNDSLATMCSLGETRVVSQREAGFHGPQGIADGDLDNGFHDKHSILQGPAANRHMAAYNESVLRQRFNVTSNFENMHLCDEEDDPLGPHTLTAEQRKAAGKRNGDAVQLAIKRMKGKKSPSN